MKCPYRSISSDIVDIKMEDTFREIRKNPKINFEHAKISEKSDMINILHLLRESDENMILVIKGNKKKFLPEMMRIAEKEDYSKFFFRSEIKTCPLKHDLVPRHRLATEEELENLEKRKIPISSLPKIKMEDIIIRWHGWKHGVIAIERDEGVYYRRIN